MNLVHFSQTNWVWFSFLNLKSKMKIKGLLNVIPGIFNLVHMLLFIFFNSPFLDCKGITQPFQHMTYGLWFFFFFFFFFFFSFSFQKLGWFFFLTECFFRKFRITVRFVPVGEICLRLPFFELFRKLQCAM